MSEVATKDFRVDELFSIHRGDTKYIKRYYQEHPGVYPVYSASTYEDAVAGWIDSYDFDSDCLSWTTNGYAGQVFRRTGRFSATRDVGILIPKAEYASNIDLDYFVPALTTAFTSAAVGRFKENGERDYTKIATKMAASVFVGVPIDEDGRPDLKSQQEIAARFSRVSSAQKKLKSIERHLNALNITSPTVDIPASEFAIKELFEMPQRGKGKYTKSYIRSRPGPYPVYSGSSFRDEVIGHIDSYDFDGPYITWVADGYAGFAFERRGPFSANSHCGILRLNKDFEGTIYLPYVELFLTPILLDVAVGRYRDDGTPDYTRVTTGMVEQCRILLPTNEAGVPDVVRQKAIADRMIRVRKGKAEILNLLNRLSAIKVTVAGLEG